MEAKAALKACIDVTDANGILDVLNISTIDLSERLFGEWPPLKYAIWKATKLCLSAFADEQRMLIDSTVAILHLLIERGANVRFVEAEREGKRRRSSQDALLYACYCCSPPVVIELLVSCGCDVNARNNANATPLMIVCQERYKNAWLEDGHRAVDAIVQSVSKAMQHEICNFAIEVNVTVRQYFSATLLSVTTSLCRSFVDHSETICF